VKAARTVTTGGWENTVWLCVLSLPTFIHLASLKVHVAGVTPHPDKHWMMQIAWGKKTRVFLPPARPRLFGSIWLGIWVINSVIQTTSGSMGFPTGS
jgi:hypothetical protein